MKNYSKMNTIAMHHASSETPTYTETKFTQDQILTSKDKIGSTKANPLNLRTDTDMSSAPVVTLDPETKIAYEEVDEEWVKVVGYVKKKYITL